MPEVEVATTTPEAESAAPGRRVIQLALEPLGQVATSSAALPVLQVVVRDAHELAEVRALLRAAMPALRESRARTEALMNLLLPSPERVPGPGAVAQARRNAAFRTAFVDEFGLLTAAEVAERSGSRAKNHSATANRWRAANRIFAVSLRGSVYYPGLQFDEEGQPREALAPVLAVLGDHLEGWELASWLTTARPELDGNRPIDVVETMQDDVLRVARWLAEDRVERDRTTLASY